MSWRITADSIRGLARGAAVLGTGGGGDPYIGSLLARQAVGDGFVEVVPLEELPDDAMVVTAAMMGAPTVMIEKLPSLDEVIAPIRALERNLGRTVTHIACAEAGGVNSTIPIAAAAALGLPLVDGDGMGRAFPELQMVLPTLYGITASPLGLADEKGNAAIDKRQKELFAAGPISEVGGAATPGVSLAVRSYKEPEKAVAALVGCYEAMSPGGRVLTAVLKEAPKVTKGARKHRDFTFTEIRLAFDFEATVQDLPEGVKETTLAQLKRMVSEKMTVWVGTDGKSLVQASATDWTAAAGASITGLAWS